MDSERVLQEFDKHASEFNFPVLNNAYIKLAAARISAFQGDNDWLLVFEILGFSTREIEFVDDLYAFGSCVDREGFVGEEITLTSSPKLPLFDVETNECIADWSRWSIKVGDQEMSFSPSRAEYAEAGIIIDRDPGLGTLHEIELLRFLIHRLGEKRLFLRDQVLLNYFPKCANLRKFLQSTWWQHPDVAAGEIPSENVSIRSAVEALSHRDSSLFDRGEPNTHWKCWLEAT
jgi:uncharacterized protein DUF7003